MIEGRNIFVSGQTGSGKSWLRRHYAATAARLLVWQPKREEHADAGVVFDGAAGERPALLAWWRHCVTRGSGFRLIYRPADKYDFAELDGLCHLVYLCGDMVFQIEEVGSTVPPSIFRRTDAGKAFKNLLTAGRTRGVELWVCNQRPREIPVEIKSECRQAYLFKTLEPGDQDYIRERFGVAAFEALLKLEQYQHVAWTEDGTVLVGKL